MKYENKYKKLKLYCNRFSFRKCQLAFHINNLKQVLLHVKVKSKYIKQNEDDTFLLCKRKSLLITQLESSSDQEKIF